MKERDYYPAGAYNDQNAPYNQCDAPEKIFPVTVEVTLKKEDDLTGTYYEDCCEEGCCIVCNEENWEQRFNDKRRTIPQLLEELKKRVEAELEACTDNQRKWQLKDLLWDCTGWEQEDICITCKD